jgi:TolB-like protein/class 3 adenylate cyclase/Flp pilus assembly protein TadD
MIKDEKTNMRLEIAHVLFIDIVGYSKRTTDEQSEELHELNAIVRNAEAACKAEAAGQLVLLPTGDGMALVFTGSEEEPVECALQIAQALRVQPALPVRMGIHSGPVHHVADVNARANIAGAGINIAQRVMDCGDAGHILVSKRVADDLAQSRRWQPYLHELGDVEVKHGLVVSVVNLYAGGVGNPEPPKKFKLNKPDRSAPGTAPMRSRSFIPLLIIGFLIFSFVVLAVIFAPAILHETRGRAHAAPSLSESSAPEKSVAVLPFENLSDNKENAFFADGVQDEILTNLAKVADLKVISRTSVMQYRNAVARNLREIGQQLGVAHVLEGSVQRAANQIRVNAQLINAHTDAHEWAENYDRPLNDVFAIQSEIAKAIAGQLQAHLSPSEKAAIAQAPTHDLVANDLYLRARAFDDMSNDPGAKGYLLQGIGFLEEALQRDPHFLLAQCLLSEIHSDLYWFGFDHTPARLELAHAALQEAERIQPDAGEVHVEKGLYAYHGFRDYEQARKEFELARKGLPNSSRLYLYIGVLDRRQARWDEAIKNVDKAVELDPLNFLVLEEAAFTHAGLGHFAESNRLLEKAIELSPKGYFARAQLALNSYFERADVRALRVQLNLFMTEGTEATSNAAQFFVQCALAQRDHAAAEQALGYIPAEGSILETGNFLMPRDWFVGLVARTFGDAKEAQKAFTAARTIATKTVQEQPDYAPAWSLLGMIDAGLGRKADAIAEGKRACELLPLSKDSWEAPIYVNNLALIYAWVGEKDLALEQLTISATSPGGISYGELKLEPAWDSLRGDPRFEKLVADHAPKEVSPK